MLGTCKNGTSRFGMVGVKIWMASDFCVVDDWISMCTGWEFDFGFWKVFSCATLDPRKFLYTEVFF